MAEPISLDTVNEMVQLLNQVPPGRTDQVVAQLRREQPAIYDYMLALVRPPLDQEEHDYIFSAVVIIWQVLRNSARPPGQVSAKALVRARRALMRNFQQIIRLPPEARQGHVALQLKSHPEPALLGYITAVVGRKPGKPFDPDARIVAHEALWVVLDALLASRPPEGPLRPAERRSAD